MAYELPSTAQTGLNTAAATDIPASVARGIKDVPGFGIVNTLGYSPQERQAVLQPDTDWERIGLTIEAFGAGVKGEEPLFLKLRRQKMLEAQQQQEQTIKLMQIKQQQVEQSNLQFFKSMEMLKDNPKAMNQYIAQEALNGTPAAQVFKRAGVTTKDVDLITSPDFMTELATASPSFHGKLTEALKGGNIQSVDPNEAQYWAKNVKVRIEKKLEARAESDEFASLQQRVKSGEVTPDSPEGERFTELSQKREKRILEFNEAKLKQRQATVAADVAEKTKDAQITQAGQAAAPKMRQYPVDQEGNVRVEQFDGTKWVTLADKVKVSPTTSITTGGEPKAMPPEQAARFAHFLEAREAAKQLPALIFDKGGNIKSENLLTGAFPMGGLPFTEGRTLNQVIERGIQAKLRAETGAAAPENEVKNIALRYKPSFSDSKAQIKGKLEAFTSYIEDAIWLADPTGAHQGRAAARKPIGDANKRGDALKKLHPDWTDYEVLARLNAEGY